MPETNQVKLQVMKCVEGGLAQVLGHNGGEATRYYLTMDGVSLADSFDRPEKFIDAVRRIFGAGSTVLEDNFVSCMTEVFKMTRGKTFQETVMQARRLGS